MSPVPGCRSAFSPMLLTSIGPSRLSSNTCLWTIWRSAFVFSFRVRSNGTTRCSSSSVLDWTRTRSWSRSSPRNTTLSSPLRRWSSKFPVCWDPVCPRVRFGFAFPIFPFLYPPTAGKFPTPVAHAEDLNNKITEVRSTIKFQLKKVLCLGVAVGHVQMNDDQVLGNVMLSEYFFLQRTVAPPSLSNMDHIPLIFHC